MKYTPGKYKVISVVKIRRGAEILPANQIGLLKVGDEVNIIDTIVDNYNVPWGQITDVNSARKAGWICMETINRKFVQRVEPPTEDRLAKLETWARTMGYDG
jgi:hypothetical protein